MMRLFDEAGFNQDDLWRLDLVRIHQQVIFLRVFSVLQGKLSAKDISSAAI